MTYSLKAIVLTLICGLLIGGAVGLALGSPAYHFEACDSGEVVYPQTWYHIDTLKRHNVVLNDGTIVTLTSAAYLQYLRTGIFPLEAVN